jgi:hypothetical protein
MARPKTKRAEYARRYYLSLDEILGRDEYQKGIYQQERGAASCCNTETKRALIY